MRGSGGQADGAEDQDEGHLGIILERVRGKLQGHAVVRDSVAHHVFVGLHLRGHVPQRAALLIHRSLGDLDVSVEARVDPTDAAPILRGQEVGIRLGRVWLSEIVARGLLHRSEDDLTVPFQ